MPRTSARRRPMPEVLEGRALLATLTVTNVNDSGAGSLRQAIIDANAAAAPSKIDFDIPGGGVRKIALSTELPEIDAPVTIDGSSQPGYAGSPLIQLDGAKIPPTSTDATPSVVPGAVFNQATGLRFEELSNGSLVQDLIITRFGASAIFDHDSGIRILGNFIGVEPTPAAGTGNGAAGILVGGPQGASDTGTTISGNTIGQSLSGIEIDFSAGTKISGNFIGTDAAGTALAGNYRDGIAVDDSTTATTATGNTIANNGYAAIEDLSNGGLTAANNTTFNNGSAVVSFVVTASTTSIRTTTGSSIGVTYTVTNKGTSAASGVRLNLVAQSNRFENITGMPSYFPSTVFAFAGGTTSQGTVSPAVGMGTSYVADLGSIAAGASATVTIDATIIGPGRDGINATVSSNNPLPPTLPTLAATAIDATAAIAPAVPVDLVVASAAAPAAGAVGAPETFTFTVSNRSAQAVDPLFALSTNAAAAASVGSIPDVARVGVIVSQGTVNPLQSFSFDTRYFGGDLVSVAPGASATVTVVIVPKLDRVVSASLYAYAADVTDPNPGDNLAFAAAAVAPQVLTVGALAAPRIGPITAIYVDLFIPLDPSSAQSLANYRITSGTTPIAIRSATYDASTGAVALRLARPLPRTGPALVVKISNLDLITLRPGVVPTATVKVPRN